MASDIFQLKTKVYLNAFGEIFPDDQDFPDEAADLYHELFLTLETLDEVLPKLFNPRVQGDEFILELRLFVVRNEVLILEALELDDFFLKVTRYTLFTSS